MEIIFPWFLATWLGVKLKYSTFSHSWIYFCSLSKLDNGDEQAAQIRRELDGRLQLAEQMARVSDCFLVPKPCLHMGLSGIIHNGCFLFLILTLSRRLFENNLAGAFLSALKSALQLE